MFFFLKKMTAYEMRISDWSSDVCSSDLLFEGFMAAFSRARQVPRFIRVSDELAYEVSNSYLTPRDGGEEVEFRYLATWRRCEDTWRVEADFFALGPLV